MPFAMVARTKGGADVLFAEIDMPQAGTNEVLVRHEAIGVNFIDIYIREGAYPWPVGKISSLAVRDAALSRRLVRALTGLPLVIRLPMPSRTVPMRRTVSLLRQWWSGSGCNHLRCCRGHYAQGADRRLSCQPQLSGKTG